MQNPFTTTFSKIPDTYIPTDQVTEILENFSYRNPSESVYKITGVRGSGKTVLLAKIEEELSENKSFGGDWIVYRLSASRDMLQQFASMLYKESFVKKSKKSFGVNVSAAVLGTGGGIGVTSTEQDKFFDVGAEIDAMLQAAQAQGKKILVGIDEVAKTQEMIVFASEFGMWLRAGYPVYLICTGLYENIEQLSNVKNLTFFRRATTIKTEPLNLIRMVDEYKNKLALDESVALELAKVTMGYPYAFQMLGVLWFKKTDKESKARVYEKLQVELFAYAYEKIWEELSDNDRAFLLIFKDGNELKRAAILSKLEKSSQYSVYRDRLIRRGLLDGKRGALKLALPYFREYMIKYCG